MKTRSRKPSPSGLGANQRRILALLAANGGVRSTPQLVAALRNIDPAGVYRALHSLEQRKLISRERQPRPHPTIVRLREGS